MTIGKGIAICGIWGAVAACSFSIGFGCIAVAFFAMLATLGICESN
jgi:hypothetical protein